MNTLKSTFKFTLGEYLKKRSLYFKDECSIKGKTDNSIGYTLSVREGKIKEKFRILKNENLETKEMEFEEKGEESQVYFNMWKDFFCVLESGTVETKDIKGFFKKYFSEKNKYITFNSWDFRLKDNETNYECQMQLFGDGFYQLVDLAAGDNKLTHQQKEKRRKQNEENNKKLVEKFNQELKKQRIRKLMKMM